MKIFVTGATGFVGSAVVDAVMAAGHQVVGLARSDASARKLEQLGAEVARGDIYDLESVQRGVARAEAVIHTAFDHDFSKYVENCRTDQRVIEAMGEALAGSARPLLVTSGLVGGAGEVSTETMAVSPGPRMPPRGLTEVAAGALRERGIPVSVVRLPPTVHGEGDHGFVPMLIEVARQKGASAYVGAGENRWPAVHRLDAAQVYLKALEGGCELPRYHAVAESGVAFRAIAEAIGRGLGLPVVSVSEEEAAAHFGWFAGFAGRDVVASSEVTREALSWAPNHAELLPDLDAGHYFTR